MDNKKEVQKRYRGATIGVVANGFIITIGCQTIVAETPNKLLKLITDYLDDPNKAEKDLIENSISFCTIPPVEPTARETQGNTGARASLPRTA